jgi:hypothetical protein
MKRECKKRRKENATFFHSIKIRKIDRNRNYKFPAYCPLQDAKRHIIPHESKFMRCKRAKSGPEAIKKE